MACFVSTIYNVKPTSSFLFLERCNTREGGEQEKNSKVDQSAHSKGLNMHGFLLLPGISSNFPDLYQF